MIDLLVDDGLRRSLVEAKSGRTITSGAFRSLERWESLLGAGAPAAVISQLLVYGGASARRRANIEVVPWTELALVDW